MRSRSHPEMDIHTILTILKWELWKQKQPTFIFLWHNTYFSFGTKILDIFRSPLDRMTSAFRCVSQNLILYIRDSVNDDNLATTYSKKDIQQSSW